MTDEIEKASSFLDLPAPTKESSPRQRSINISDLFLTRFMPPWSRPPSLPAYTWRTWVLNQPVAMDAREFLISSLLSLDWKITPRNSKYQEELEPTIRYYTDLIINGGKYDELGLDYAGLTEWVAGDLLDIPFGGAVEVGRRGDVPGGRVVWIRPLDGGTLYPTLNKDFPVVQYYMGWDAVAFPEHALVRTYMSPQQFLWREGWGMAPPEKVYFAMDLLNRGDKYYANLLLDIPTAGVFDLGDMERSAAEEWIQSFKDFTNNITESFKIPVLYEHNNKAEFIPLGKVPNDIMFDKITHKYAALLCAAYGISAQDIGLSTTTSSGETLAGSIRSQRQTKITGRARVKAKMKSFWDRILPRSLEFNYIDYDTEEMINLGRARLASATSFQILQDKGAVSRQEVRSQVIQDGLFTINMPDELPADAKEMAPQPTGAFGKKNPTEPELVGNKKSPSQGGEGEVKKSITYKVNQKKLESLIGRTINQVFPEMYEKFLMVTEDDLFVSKSEVLNTIFSDGNLYGLPSADDVVSYSFDGFDKDDTESIKAILKSGTSDMVNKSVLVAMLNNLYVEDNLDDVQIQDVLNGIKSTLEKSLTAYLQAYVQDVQSQFMLDEPVELEVKSAVPAPYQLQLPNITVNIPERSMVTNINTPAPLVTVEKGEPPVVNVQVDKAAPPVINVERPAPPIVHVASPVLQPNINVNVPKQPPPNVTVNTEAPVVNMSVPEQAAPIIQVTNEVNPAHVNVDVKIPKETSRIQYVHRDSRQNIDYTETDINYEDDAPKSEE